MRKPGMSDHLHGAFVYGDGGAGHHDGCALSVADGDADVGNGNESARRSLEQDSASRAGDIADEYAVLASGLNEHLWHSGRSGERQRWNLGGGAPVTSHPDGIVGIALFEFDPDARVNLRHGIEARLNAGE